jgi:modulator of FtsH protease
MSPETWENFFLGQLGATAALAGLLFVAVSINVDRIVRIPGLADRGFEVLLTLLGVLTLSALMLVPGQSPTAAGIEVLAVSILTVGGGVAVGLRGLRRTEAAHRLTFTIGLLVFLVAFAFCVVGGIVLLAGSAAGLYWVAAGMCIGVARAIIDAWVLLVEINR